GEVVHPQHWPESLDYAGKKVVVIGSGATAVRLLPALATRASHVTMLQRSRTYLYDSSRVDPVTSFLRKWLPDKLAYTLIRLRFAVFYVVSFQLAKKVPALVKRNLRRTALQNLPTG